MKFSIHTEQIGKHRISRIEEQIVSGPAQMLLPRLQAEALAEHAAWLEGPHYSAAEGVLFLSIHSWLLRTPHHTILIDTCAGNHKPRTRPEQADFANLDTPYLERLSVAGVQPAEIDYVFCTHLHVDHVGWNTRLDNGQWVPTFPDARYLFSRTDYEYWHVDNRQGADPHANDGVFEDSVLPVVTAGLAELIGGSYAIEDDVIIRPQPGHTPGHLTLELGIEGADAVFSGDIMHHPIQVYYPDCSSCFCELPEQARQTRHRLLERCADTRTIVLPGHFAAPHMGRVQSSASGFRFEFV